MLSGTVIPDAQVLALGVLDVSWPCWKLRSDVYISVEKQDHKLSDAQRHTQCDEL